MLYCPNPTCKSRNNPDLIEVCQSCETQLLLQGRYQLDRLLYQRQFTSTELFTIIDRHNPQNALVLKTLVSSEAKVQDLFQREQNLLLQADHSGMPKGRDAFSVRLKNSQSLQCLVMDYIPGETLEEWLKHNSVITEAQAIDWLKQLLHTLNYIHQQNIFHRDIKPSNIIRKPDGKLVLIDFGSTRQVTETVLRDRTSTAIVSFGYTAPEQISGKAVLQSDIYALGKTIMYLLMGSDFEEQSFAPRHPISPELKRLLNQMTAIAVSDRPTTVKHILKQLKTIEQKPHRQRLQQISLGFGIGAICGGLLMIPLMRQINWEVERNRLFPQSTCDQQLNDRLSCGEESLMRVSELETFLGSRAVQAAETKQEGIQFFKTQNWQQAQQAFQTVWDQTQDPEALIYLNNLKIKTNPQAYRKTATIAAVIPLGGSQAAMKRGLNILRGVSQAQSQAIASGIGLQILLGDDQNDNGMARQLARDLVRRQDIIAVIGHHVSDTTLAALERYENAGMVVISPTSTSEELATHTLKKNNLFFRTVHSDRVTATFMASFLLNRTQARNVAVFYNPDKSYSRSLSGAFKETFQALQGNIISDPQGQFYLSCTGYNCQRSPFNVNEALKKAKQQGADAFVVVPDSAESKSNALTDAIAITKAAGSTWVIAGDAMAGEAQLLNAQMVDRTIIASTWDPNQDSQSIFRQFWQVREEIPEPSLSWHTYTAYNAVQVIIQALTQRPETAIDRSQLRQILAAPAFSAPGATGPIRFRDGTGEIQATNMTLVKVTKCKVATKDQGDRILFQALEKDCPP
jgi:eukaryotic-like serine/threonine-protein kinase